jgi:hypothetical protein
MPSTQHILARIVHERLNFDQLFAFSEPKRVLRSKTVRGPNLKIESYADSMYYFFNFKSYPSTTGERWKGYIKFYKPDDSDTPIEKIDCLVDCGCPDYRFVYAYANYQRDAGDIGPDSINQCIDRAPRIKNPRGIPGLCKHLLALRNFLYGQDSTFPPADDPDDSDEKKKLVNNARSKMEQIVQAANGLTIDDEGAPVDPLVAEVPQPPPPPIPGSAAAAARELELRRRNQIRTQGGDPDAPEAADEQPATAPNVPNAVPPLPDEPQEPQVLPPQTDPNLSMSNPTTRPNPTNPRNTSNRRQPPRRESIVRNMNGAVNISNDVKFIQELVDGERAAIGAAPPAPVPNPTSPAPEGAETKTPSQQALDSLKNMEQLLSTLVQLQQEPETPEEMPEPEPDMGPNEPPMPSQPAPSALPAAPSAPRRAPGPRRPMPVQ